MEHEVKLTKLAKCAGCGAKVGAGVKLAIDKLPVISLLLFVIVERDAASEVLNADCAVVEYGYVYPVPIAFSRFVDGV